MNIVPNSKKISDIIRSCQLDPLDTKILVKHVTGFNDSKLITNSNYELTNVECVSLNQLIARRVSGEPLHYIVGYKEFYSYKFRVTKDTLIPRPETELLVDEVLKLADKNAKVLDLGTGSGCIAISCKLERPDLQVVASDKCQDALQIASFNANTLNANVKFIKGDWFENITGEFCIITSNPPYIAKNDYHLGSLYYEPKLALTDGNDGLDSIKHIIINSRNYLTNNGYLILEHGYNQKYDICQLLIENGYTNITTIKDYANLDRVTTGKLS